MNLTEDEWDALMAEGFAVVPDAERGPRAAPWRSPMSAQWKALMEGKTIIVPLADRMKFAPNFYSSARRHDKRLRTRTTESGVVMWLEDREG